MDVDLIWNVVGTWNDRGWLLGLVHASFFLFGTIFMGLLGTAITRLADRQPVGGNMLRYLAITLAATLAAGCTTYTIVILPQQEATEQARAQTEEDRQRRVADLEFVSNSLTGSWRPETATCDEALDFAVSGERLTITTPGGLSVGYTIGSVADQSISVSSESGEQTIYRPVGNRLREDTNSSHAEYEKCIA